MIVSRGFRLPTAQEKRYIRENADNTFLASAHLIEPPALPNCQYELSTAIAVKLKCLPAHTDSWLGAGSPRFYLAFFWLIDAPNDADFELHVGLESVRMHAGRFVLFRDTTMHSVYARRTWRGYACQVRASKRCLPPKEIL